MTTSLRPFSPPRRISSVLNLVICVVSTFLVHASAFAQDAEGSADASAEGRAPISVAMDFGGRGVSRPGKGGDKFQRVGIYPHEVVTVTVRYPAAMAGQEIVAEALDGARILANDSVLELDSNGQLTFRVQAGDLVGLSRVTLFNGDSTQTLQFWVIDRDHPGNDS